jgi:flagellin-like hook-associated protein FlgL
MVATSIATLTQNEILRSRILEIQTEMLKTQVQTATGKKSDVYSGLRSDARTSISLNNTQATIKTYQQTIATTKARMDTMQAVLGRISDICVEVRNTALQVQGAEATATGATSAALKSLAQNRLKEITTLLNTEVDGRHLFAGTKIASSPMIDPGAIGAAGTPLDTVNGTAPALANSVASGQARYVQIAGATNTANGAAAAGATVIPLNSAPNGVVAGTQLKFSGQATVYTVASVGPGNQVTLSAPLGAGVANGETVNFIGQVDENASGFYYQGDTTGAQVSARIDDGFDLQYGMRGDDRSFATIMGALYALATGDLTTTSDAGYRELARLSMNDLDNGFDQLQEQIGVLGVRQNTIEQTETRHTDFLITLKQQITDVEDVDTADALVRLSLLQTNLEASFKLISTTQDLSLVNFLS